MNAETKAILKPRIELARVVYAYTMDILHRALAHGERVSEAEVNALPRLTEILLNTELNDIDFPSLESGNKAEPVERAATRKPMFSFADKIQWGSLTSGGAAGFAPEAGS